MKVGAAALILLLGVANDAAAQNCEAILGYVRDTTEHSSTQDYRFSFKRFFCDQTFSSYQEAHDRGLKLGIVVESLPISFGGFDRGNQWSQYQRTICENLQVESSLYSTVRDVISKANESVVAAWTKCVAAPGVHFWAEANQTDPKVVSLVGSYNGLQRRYEIKIKPIKITPAGALKCESLLLNDEGILNNQQSSIVCTRQAVGDTLPAANVVLPTAGGGGAPSIKLPAVSTAPVYADRTTEKSVICERYRYQFIDDNQRDGDKNVFHLECTAPGPVSRWEDLGCEGHPCGWLERLPGADAQPNPNTVVLRLKTNSSDPVKIRFKIYYNETSRVCVKNCPS